MEKDGPAGRSVEGDGSDGSRNTCYTVWDSRPSINPFHSWKGLARYPTNRGRFGLDVDDLKAGCGSGVYEEVEEWEARRLVKAGKMVYSAFVVWQGEGAERKGRLVLNFSQQSLHWPKGTVKMETFPSFALSLMKHDCLMSWDIKSGY
jgi:hypothetical protein